MASCSCTHTHIYIYKIYMYVCMYVYICEDGSAVGFVEFTKLLFSFSSLAQPCNLVRSIPEHIFVILSKRKACVGRFHKETSRKKNRSNSKMAAPEASDHPVRNRLCYHFSLYQTNESCSQSVSRRVVLFRNFNKSCLRVTAPNVTRAERSFNGHSRMVQHVTRRLLLQLLASVLSSHVRFQILDSSYQFNLCRWYY